RGIADPGAGPVDDPGEPAFAPNGIAEPEIAVDERGRVADEATHQTREHTRHLVPERIAFGRWVGEPASESLRGGAVGWKRRHARDWDGVDRHERVRKLLGPCFGILRR